ncbi:MAG TPA: lysine 5,6-aminomutase subunit alpha, partial [Streptosporangiaceae bacterium]
MQSRAPKLTIDPQVVAEARALARQAGQPIVEMARAHTTVSVERAVLRLAGLAGADAENMPLVNRVVDAVRQQTGLEQGVALPVWDALITGEFTGLAALAEATAAG